MQEIVDSNYSVKLLKKQTGLFTKYQQYNTPRQIIFFHEIKKKGATAPFNYQFILSKMLTTSMRSLDW